MSEEKPKPEIHRWLAEPLPNDVSRSIERLAAANDIRHIAVMPDVHLSGDVCVGLAIATRRLIYPAAVGGDIGCGMAALPFDTSADVLASASAAAILLKGLHARIPAIRHPRKTMPYALPSTLADQPLSHPRLEKLKTRDGLVQLGTLGRGNHFAEFQADDEGCLWLMLHSGSRGMGQAITQHHLAVASAGRPASALTFLDAESDGGRAYLADAAWATDYAVANRLAMIEAICGLVRQLFRIEADRSRLIHCHHNHVQRETHFGQDWWVHRKGALSAATDLPGVIPGSMGTTSYHVTGRGCELALCSSSHGAGRVLSRGEAMRRISQRQLEREMEGVWFDPRMADRLRDEAPSAYKEIGTVMRSQRELTRIDRRLRPLLSFKGG
jgi:tRNA-splicing ligase RtcB (3'-phosphate/5'-hydroxy nucleic acid ligase)